MNISVEDRAIKYVAKAADGSMRDALSLLDQCIAFYLGKELKKTLDKLEDDTMKKRVRHVITEIARVNSFVRGFQYGWMSYTNRRSAAVNGIYARRSFLLESASVPCTDL